jgi:hypothetical protein
MSTGAVIWEGASAWDGAPLVVVVTWNSSNRKTGNMAQTWILRQDIRPTDAVKTRADESICGMCPHRGDVATGAGRSCYVNVGQAPQAVYRAYVEGKYPRMSPAEAGLRLAGRGVRLGAYGDPAMVPIEVWQDLTADAAMHTGYTHQWRTLDQAWAHFLMASADSVEDRRDARLSGWRSFFVAPRGAAVPDGAVLCMAERDKPRSCLDCGACAGTRGRDSVAVDIFIEAHGSGAKYVA